LTEFSGGPGFAAFIATFSMVLVTLVLMRSLNKQLRKVRTSHHEAGAEDEVMTRDDASGIEDGDGRGNEHQGEPRDS
jgi:hypothetical protein